MAHMCLRFGVRMRHGAEAVVKVQREIRTHWHGSTFPESIKSVQHGPAFPKDAKFCVAIVGKLDPC